jgi:hypothetical protein
MITQNTIPWCKCESQCVISLRRSILNGIWGNASRLDRAEASGEDSGHRAAREEERRVITGSPHTRTRARAHTHTADLAELALEALQLRPQLPAQVGAATLELIVLVGDAVELPQHQALLVAQRGVLCLQRVCAAGQRVFVRPRSGVEGEAG